MAAVLLHLCFAFVLWVCTIFPPVTAGRCPSSCSCLGNNVDCSKRGLISVPTDIEPWVTRLELQSNGITEIRPDDFKRLSNLTHLDMSNNAVSVINGSVFGDLINLRTLILDSNQLSEIPEFVVPMNVTHLAVRENHIVTIPLVVLQAMPKIEHLDLTHNNILSLSNGSFPVGCPLKLLNLNNNQISAIERGSLSNLTTLEVLKLNGNKLTELPQAVFNNLAKLRTLEMMRNKLSGIKGLTFKGLDNLQVLKLKRNNIRVLSDGAFYGLRITNLQMDRNRVTNITKGWLFGLRTLKQLTLSYNHISSVELDAWKPCRVLEKLNLTHNRMTAITKQSLAHLVSLRALYMDRNRISRIDAGSFTDLAKLSVMQLNHNEISWTMEDFPGAFRGLWGLTRLGLRHNTIRSIAVHTFSGLPRLRQLLLEDNAITSIKENVFETLRNLRDLRFNSTKLFCDCQLSWLPVWLQHNGFQSTTHGTCYHPAVLRGLDIYKVDPQQLACTKVPKPVIRESPKSGNGYKGENLTLSCTIGMSEGNQPVIHWKRDNMPLGEDNVEVVASSDGEISLFTSYLHLVDIQDSMAGSYHCVASNDFGSVFSQRAYINVYVYPSFSKKPKDVTVKAGKPAELKCAATGKPPPKISWKKDGGVSFPAARERRMQLYPDDDRVYIVNTRPADEGVYSCMAKSDAGMIVYNATLTVLETPDFVKPMQRRKNTRQGETAVLQCVASGSPPPKLRWMKDNQELVMTPRHFFTVGNQLLVIVETKPSDSGIYSCRVSNSLGTAKGATKLQVFPSSGKPTGADSSVDGGGSSSSFGLDDESTTTGIIIIAVVCCVVGTSLVWVIIIYQTRKRHEVYSATPTDETTLPVEVPSSGYMSSDKEGSYTQGVPPPSYYYYQDYQMKESGYESSSGQYRANGQSRAMAMFAHDDDNEDDQGPPVVTAGDRLLQQMRDGGHHQSKSSLQYPVSDGEDTIGSRHSTSSGQHSGASTSTDPPSSHNSGQSASGHHHQRMPPTHHHQHSSSQLLSILTNPLSGSGSAEFIVHAHPSPPYPSSSTTHNPSTSGKHTPLSQIHSPRPVHLQTFHPTKPTNHDRLNRSISAISTTSSLGRNYKKEEEEEGGFGCENCGGCDNIDCNNTGKLRVNEERHQSDSCDNKDVGYQQRSSPFSSSSPCAACHAMRVAGGPRYDSGCAGGNGSNNNLRQIRSPLSSSQSDNSNVQAVHPLSSCSSSSPSSSSTPSQKCNHQGQQTISNNGRLAQTPQDRLANTLPSSSSSSSSKHPKSFCTDCTNSISSSSPSSPHSKYPPHHPSSCSCSESIIPSSSSHQRDRPHCMPCGQSSPSSSPSKPMGGARTLSSSSVGQDPMYFAYQDHCLPSPSLTNTKKGGKQHNCDANVFSHSNSCSDCGQMN